VHHAVAIDKLLLHACGCPMGFRRMFDQFEGIAELGVQRIWRIPHHREPAALHRPVRPEHRDNDVTAGAHSLAHLCDVGLALLGCAHEMKDGPVVPDLVGLCGQGKLSDVSHKPSPPPGVDSEPLTGPPERTLTHLANRSVDSMHS